MFETVIDTHLPTIPEHVVFSITATIHVVNQTVRRAGRDLTIVTYGGSLPRALAAARVLADGGIEAEVIDLRTLRPLDHDTVVLRKTNKPGKLRPLDAGDSYDVSMLVTWSCGTGAYLQAEYRFTATYPAPPDVQVVSYDVI